MSQIKAHFIFIWIGILCISSFQINAEQEMGSSWKTSLPDGFSTEISLSHLSLSIADTLIIELTLRYPNGFKPQIDTFRKALFSPYGPTASPFTLIRETTSPKKTIAENQIEEHRVFTLSPQLSGTHPLALREISFLPLDAKTDKKQKVFLPIFQIRVEMPSDPFQPQLLIASLMPLTQKLPITLSSTNRQNYTHNPKLAERAAIEGMQAIQQKQFPWIFPLLMAVCTIVFLLIKYSPHPSSFTKHTQSRLPSLSPEKTALQAIHQLSSRQNHSYFHHLDHIVRRYFKERYSIDILSSTTPELLNQLQKTSTLPQDTKQALLDFFESNDKKKFSSQKHSQEEYIKAKNQVIALIQPLE
jgi:hypothetical protein